MDTVTSPKRYDYIDNLKVFLIILVIFHHAGQAYGDGGDWGYHISNPEEYVSWIWRFFSVNAAYFMGLYFMISGFFVPGSYERQGFWKFLGKKFMRLGIPLAAMGGFLTYATGELNVAQMWFVEQLLFYCIVYAIVMLVVRYIKGRSKISACGNVPASSSEKRLKYIPAMLAIFGTACGLSLICYYVRAVSPQNSWTWLLGFLRAEPAHLPQYVLLFILGIIASNRGWFDRMPKSVGASCFAIAMAISFCWWFAPTGGRLINLITDNIAVSDSFVAIFMSIGLVWLFRDCFNKTNKFLKWCADQAYGAYVFHILLMLAFQYMIDGLWLGGGTQKFILVGIVITVVSFGLTWLLRLIPGVKKVL